MLLLWASQASAAPGKELTRAPELLEFVAAKYPAGERREATVVLSLAIDAAGSVTAAEVVTSAGAAFDAAARAAVLSFKFRPAEIEGRPAAIRIAYRYRFTPPALPATAGLAGHVRRQGTGEALGEVRLTLTGPGLARPLVAVTDAAGRFEFLEVPEGRVGVVLAGAELPAVTTEETLVAGTQHDVVYEVTPVSPPRDDVEIVVVAPPVRREVAMTSVRADEAAKVPGASGDVLRVVESLPGVGRAAAGSGQLIVWGAAPQDTRVYVDGVPVPRLYHEGGLRSVVHPALVDSLALMPGGQGAAWGRGLGGVVAVTTRTADEPRVRGRVAADTLDASAVVTVPLGKKVWLTTAIRGAYLKNWADRVVPAATRAYVPIPRYGDGQLRLAIRPSASDRVELVGMVAVDRFNRGVPNVDPALAVLDERAQDFGRVYGRWVRDRGEGHVLIITPYVGLTRTRHGAAFGELATSLSAETLLAGLRMSRRSRVSRWLTVEIGVDAEASRTRLDRRGALALPAREGDIRVFGQPPPAQIGADRWNVVLLGVAPYAQAELSLWSGRFVISPGVRVDPYARSVSRRNPPAAGVPAVGLNAADFSVEPRLAILGEPHARVRLRGAVGLYRQMPAAEDLSAAFGDPRLPAPRALHVVAGAGLQLTETLGIELTGFFVRLRRLAMRSADEAPLVGEALVADGLGRAVGLQVMLRQELHRGLFGWVAYTLSRAERQARADAPARLSDYDQTHLLTAALAYALPRGFNVGARLRMATGFPRTPVAGAFYDASRDLFQPQFGGQNTIRVPLFAQLDARVARRFAIRHTSLDVFLEVQNLWNRQNAEEIVYSPDYSQTSYIRGFPLLPAFGLQWEL